MRCGTVYLRAPITTDIWRQKGKAACDAVQYTFRRLPLVTSSDRPLRPSVQCNRIIAEPWDEGGGFELAKVDFVRVAEPGFRRAPPPAPCRVCDSPSQLATTRAQSYQDGDVAMSPPRPHFMSPRPHSEGVVHSGADGVQNWPKCIARNLWKLNSHLVPNCNPRMWRMLFSVFFYSSLGPIIKNRKWMFFLSSRNFNFSKFWTSTESQCSGDIIGGACPVAPPYWSNRIEQHQQPGPNRGAVTMQARHSA